MFGHLFDFAAEAPSAAPQPHDAPPPPAPTAPDWQGIDFLAGGTWTATSGGAIYQESIGRTLNGWFLSSTATSTPASGTAIITNGFLGVDQSGKLLLMWGFRSDGSTVQMRQLINAPGQAPKPTWIFEGVSRGQQVRQTMIQTGPDSMETSASILVQGKWQAYPALPYSRTVTAGGGGPAPS